MNTCIPGVTQLVRDREARGKTRRFRQLGSDSPHNRALGGVKEEEKRKAKWAGHEERLWGYQSNSKWERLKKERQDTFQKHRYRLGIGSTLMFFKGHK